MQPMKLPPNKPEEIIEKALINLLQNRGWLVRKVHGTDRNSGWPDLRISHYRYGGRWVEVKLPELKGSRFTAAQKEWFPKMEANGDKIWILTGADEYNYSLLFKESNFGTMLTLYGMNKL